MKTFVEKLVDVIYKEELNLDFPYYEGEQENEVITSREIDADAQVGIDIDKLMAILEELRSKGASHVYIDYHIDHFGYIFYGTKLVEV